MLKSGRAVKSTRVLQHIRRESGLSPETLNAGVNFKFGGGLPPQLAKPRMMFSLSPQDALARSTNRYSALAVQFGAKA